MLRVTGRVQGVGFRAWTERLAHQLKLDGWVQNCDDGAVEIVVWASNQLRDQFIAALKVGPPSAQVTSVEILSTRLAVQPGIGFSIRRG